jgi:hypothetical protein
MRSKLTLLVAILCLVVTVGFMQESQAKGIELADGKIILGTEARIRYEFFENTDFTSAQDRRDFVVTRLRPSLTFLPHEQLEILFQPQFTGAWGESSSTLVNSGAAGASSGSLNDPVLGLHQAYLRYAPIDWFAMTAGRQELIYGDQLVIGNVDWNNTGRAFDALKLRFSANHGSLDVIASILNDTEASHSRGTAASAGDAYLFGLYSSYDFGDYLKNLDFYALYRFDDTADPRPHNYVTTGARLKAEPSAFDYRIEANFQYGEQANADRKDYQADLEAGYTFEESKKFRIGLEAFIASLNYNQLFPTAHKWIGFVDLFGRRNILGGVVHLSMKPGDRWVLKLDAHTFFRNKKSAGLFALNGTTAIGAAGTSNARLAGEEIDLTAIYKPLEYLTFQGGVSAFIPMGFIKTNAGSKVPLFGYLQVNAMF